jgi:hypothetical protein
LRIADPTKLPQSITRKNSASVACLANSVSA